MLFAFGDAKEILEYVMLREIAEEDVRDARRMKRAAKAYAPELNNG